MRISDWSSDVCSSDLFPYGGMENPRLTFATPTVIVGDKSLVSLVAHELAHSWSGNLVTFSTSRDAWLNEGLTSYVENRIVEALRSEEHTSELQSLMRISYAVFCLKKKTKPHNEATTTTPDI